MLINNFFDVVSAHDEEGTITRRIRFNPAHEIFAGHFPGQPVVPGVCMLQLVKEFMEEFTHTRLMMKKAEQCKFLSVIDPVKTPEVQVVIKPVLIDADWRTTATISEEGQTFFKLNALFSRNLSL